MSEHTKFRDPKVLQIAFWVVVYLLSVYFFVNVADWKLGLAKSTFSVAMMMALFYLNYYYLSPQFYEKKRFGLYFSLSFGLVLLITLIRVPVERYFLQSSIFPMHAGMVRVLPWIVFISNGVMAVVSFTARHADLGYQLEKQQKETENKQLQAELNFLKAQINPHFLFNTLNNIYTLALLKSDEAPDMIAKLSELMRYLIYEADVPKVPFSKEVAFLQNYVSLYRLKYGNHQRLHFDVQADAEHSIEPMLFVSLVENCFKYADLDRPDGFIHLRIEASANQILLYAANSIDRRPTVEDTRHGVGLRNLQQRLDLLYPERHEVSIRAQEKSFEVSLQLFVTT
ncbi:MAG: sensor histidine kinase [Spirosomataceae bacterium]